jgi:hypothetical protein
METYGQKEVSQPRFHSALTGVSLALSRFIFEESLSGCALPVSDDKNLALIFFAGILFAFVFFTFPAVSLFD